MREKLRKKIIKRQAIFPPNNKRYANLWWLEKPTSHSGKLF